MSHLPGSMQRWLPAKSEALTLRHLLELGPRGLLGKSGYNKALNI